MAMQLELRNGTASQWTSTNPILTLGEIGLENDTGKMKLGNGTSHWTSLSYIGVAGPTQTLILRCFGDGSDGNVTISSGTTTLARDMYYNNLTISGSGSINTNGYKIYVLNTLNLNAAAAGAIQFNGTAGIAATSATGAAAPTAATAQSVGVGGQSGAGATGVTGVGVEGGAATAVTGNGGTAGASGAGGTGTSGAGGISRPGIAPTSNDFRRWETSFLRGATLLGGGCGGSGGSSGAGDGTNNGGGGGSGGNGGNVIAIYARVISKTSSTPAGVIQCNGGNGGNGFSVTTGVCGGGSGAGGGAGGWVYIAYQVLGGPQILNAIQANGGNGGNGGNGFGTGGSGGAGGSGGGGGRILLFQVTVSGSIENFNQTNSQPPQAGSPGLLVNNLDGGSGGFGAMLTKAL